MRPFDATTVPLRCPNCGQQTHKSLEAIRSEAGFTCACGTRIEIDVDEFEGEIRKVRARIRDFNRKE